MIFTFFYFSAYTNPLMVANEPQEHKNSNKSFGSSAISCALLGHMTYNHDLLMEVQKFILLFRMNQLLPKFQRLISDKLLNFSQKMASLTKKLWAQSILQISVPNQFFVKY